MPSSLANSLQLRTHLFSSSHGKKAIRTTWFGLGLIKVRVRVRVRVRFRVRVRVRVRVRG